jgi:sugar lactone lactonase YvrE
MGALAIDHQGALYLGAAGCTADLHAVYKVAYDGTVTKLSQLPVTALPNGVALRGKYLYVADTGMQLIWRVPIDGGDAEVWLDDPLLKKDPNAPPIYPGPNGLQFFHDEIYVSVSGGFRVVAIQVDHDGGPGAIRVHHSGTGCDDFAFDVYGNLYCGTDPFNTIVRIAPDGSSEVLLTAADGLDGPSSVTFGRRAGEHLDLYITNGSFPFFPPPSGTHRPSLLRVPLGIPGMPRP